VLKYRMAYGLGELIDDYAIKNIDNETIGVICGFIIVLTGFLIYATFRLYNLQHEIAPHIEL
jgi:succinate dehydrogenase hydrophobic anchor subunit